MWYKNSGRLLKALSVAAFVLYLAVLLRLTVLRDSMFRGGTQRLYPVSLKLWEYYGWFLRTGQVIQFRYLLIGNFLCLAPLGFACGYFRKGCSLVFAAAVCLGATVFIELCQLLFCVGFFELDDIILNALGGIFGYATHLIICRITERITPRSRQTSWGSQQ
ncbi:MAG: VanZ family protein [Ruminococcaceae bacterium]|nr:VanZ family protein [Oscillospiraceae bacterium]